AVPDVLRKLDRAAEQLGDPKVKQIRDGQGVYFFESPLAGPGRMAFLFPGEGSQYVDMLADLCVHVPEGRRHFDAVARGPASAGRDLLLGDLVFPPAGFTPADRRGAEERLSQMEGAVEAVVTANRAVSALLGRLGIRPDALVGHSSGEYSAMLASGMI